MRGLSLKALSIKNRPASGEILERAIPWARLRLDATLARNVLVKAGHKKTGIRSIGCR